MKINLIIGSIGTVLILAWLAVRGVNINTVAVALGGVGILLGVIAMRRGKRS